MSEANQHDGDRAQIGSVRERQLFTEETVESLAAMLRILADPTRIRLIEALNDRGRASVGALASSLPLTRQGVSKQLGILYQAGLVRRRREGMWVQYELADWTGWWLVEQLASAIGTGSGS
jgi:DNA-binding transcriptional ArsR family regulator